MRHRVNALLDVFIVEKLCVGKTRANHALVAFLNLRHIAGFNIGDAHKVFRQRALRSLQREEFLIALHGRDQRLMRHAQETGIKLAEHRTWPFH